MDDISVDTAVSREMGYQSIVSNRGARAARAHARKTLGYEEGKGEGIKGEGEGVGKGGGEGVGGEVVEGSRARRRRENKEKKERELALIGVDGQFPVRREGRVREGTRRERGTGVYLTQSTENSTELTENSTELTENSTELTTDIIAANDNKVEIIIENNDKNEHVNNNDENRAENIDVNKRNS